MNLDICKKCFFGLPFTLRVVWLDSPTKDKMIVCLDFQQLVVHTLDSREFNCLMYCVFDTDDFKKCFSSYIEQDGTFDFELQNEMQIRSVMNLTTLGTSDTPCPYRLEHMMHDWNKK